MRIAMNSDRGSLFLIKEVENIVYSSGAQSGAGSEMNDCALSGFVFWSGGKIISFHGVIANV